MPRFVTSDEPVGLDGHRMVHAQTERKRIDAPRVAYSPTAPGDWLGRAAPDEAAGALDQLAQRISANEAALGLLTDDHGELGGLLDDDHPQYLRTDGQRALTGSLKVQDELAIDVDAARAASWTATRVTFGEASLPPALDWDDNGILAFLINGDERMALEPSRLRFNNGAIDMALNFNTNGELQVQRGGGELARFKNQELDVNGIVRGSVLRADDVPSSVSGTISYGGTTSAPWPSGPKPALDRGPQGMTDGMHAGWIDIRVGNTTAWIPYWV